MPVTHKKVKLIIKQKATTSSNTINAVLSQKSHTTQKDTIYEREIHNATAKRPKLDESYHQRKYGHNTLSQYGCKDLSQRKNFKSYAKKVFETSSPYAHLPPSPPRYTRIKPKELVSKTGNIEKHVNANMADGSNTHLEKSSTLDFVNNKTCDNINIENTQISNNANTKRCTNNLATEIKYQNNYKPNTTILNNNDSKSKHAQNNSENSKIFEVNKNAVMKADITKHTLSVNETVPKTAIVLAFPNNLNTASGNKAYLANQLEQSKDAGNNIQQTKNYGNVGSYRKRPSRFSDAPNQNTTDIVQRQQLCTTQFQNSDNHNRFDPMIVKQFPQYSNSKQCSETKIANRPEVFESTDIVQPVQHSRERNEPHFQKSPQNNLNDNVTQLQYNDTACHVGHLREFDNSKIQNCASGNMQQYLSSAKQFDQQLSQINEIKKVEPRKSRFAEQLSGGIQNTELAKNNLPGVTNASTQNLENCFNSNVSNTSIDYKPDDSVSQYENKKDCYSQSFPQQFDHNFQRTTDMEYGKNLQFGMKRRPEMTNLRFNQSMNENVSHQKDKFEYVPHSSQSYEYNFKSASSNAIPDIQPFHHDVSIPPPPIADGGNHRFYGIINPAPPIENNVNLNLNHKSNKLNTPKGSANIMRFENNNATFPKRQYENSKGRQFFKNNDESRQYDDKNFTATKQNFVNNRNFEKFKQIKMGQRPQKYLQNPFNNTKLCQKTKPNIFSAKLGSSNQIARPCLQKPGGLVNQKPLSRLQNKFGKFVKNKNHNISKVSNCKESKKLKKLKKQTTKDGITNSEDDHIDVNKEIFGDFQKIAVSHKKPAKGHLKPDPEIYWKQWWSAYGHVEKSIGNIDINDESIESALSFKLTPAEPEFRKRKRILIVMGVAKILRHIRLNEEDYALRDIYNVLKYKHQLEDQQLQQHLTAKELERVEMVLRHARKKTRRALFYQSIICRFHFSKVIINRVENGESLKCGHARKLINDKTFNYLVSESVQELKKLILEDWPEFDEFYKTC